MKIEIENVQCSFLRFRPSGDRVLSLTMRYASLALRRDMPRVQQWVVSPAWVVIPLDLQPTLSQKKKQRLFCSLL